MPDNPIERIFNGDLIPPDVAAEFAGTGLTAEKLEALIPLAEAWDQGGREGLRRAMENLQQPAAPSAT